MFWIDAHCHLVSEENKAHITLSESYTPLIYLSSLLSDWEFQHKNDIAPEISHTTYYTAGIHPFYLCEKPLQLVQIDYLAKNKEIVAIGEIGLDKRNNDVDSQVVILKDLLDIARTYQLPVIFHIVGMYYPLYKILKNMKWDLPLLFHYFQGNDSIIKTFSRFHAIYSINPRWVTEHNTNFVREIIQNNYFCFETDTPSFNSFNTSSLLSVYKRMVTQVSKCSDSTEAQLKEAQWNTLNNLFLFQR